MSRDPWAWLGIAVLLAVTVTLAAIFSMGVGGAFAGLAGASSGLLYKKYRGPSAEEVEQAVADRSK